MPSPSRMFSPPAKARCSSHCLRRRSTPPSPSGSGWPARRRGAASSPACIAIAATGRAARAARQARQTRESAAHCRQRRTARRAAPARRRAPPASAMRFEAELPARGQCRAPLKPPAEMARLFAPFHAAIARTVEIAQACRFSLDDLKYERVSRRACAAEQDASSIWKTWPVEGAASAIEKGYRSRGVPADVKTGCAKARHHRQENRLRPLLP